MSRFHKHWKTHFSTLAKVPVPQPSYGRNSGLAKVLVLAKASVPKKPFTFFFEPEPWQGSKNIGKLIFLRLPRFRFLSLRTNAFPHLPRFGCLPRFRMQKIQEIRFQIKPVGSKQNLFGSKRNLDTLGGLWNRNLSNRKVNVFSDVFRTPAA